MDAIVAQVCLRETKYFFKKLSRILLSGYYYLNCSTWFASCAILDTIESWKQGCQMAYFQTKNPDLGKFWSVLLWKMLVYFTAILFILRLFGIVCPFGLSCGYLVYCFFIWYVTPRKIWQPCLEKRYSICGIILISYKSYPCIRIYMYVWMYVHMYLRTQELGFHETRF
jgi:hypothetical protein